MSKSFLFLLVLVIILGASLGGAFVGGVVLGRNQPEDAGGGLSPRLGAVGQFPGGGQDAGQTGQDRRGQRGNSGEADGGGGGAGAGVPVEQVSQEAAPAGTPAGVAATGNSAPAGSPASLGDSPGNSSGDAGSAGPSGRGGLNGTAQRLEGNVLTVVTPQGERQVMLADDTQIQQVTSASLEELSHGATVRVVGQPGDDGVLQARTIIIIPEGAASLFEVGAGARRGNRQRGSGP